MRDRARTEVDAGFSAVGAGRLGREDARTLGDGTLYIWNRKRQVGVMRQSTTIAWAIFCQTGAAVK